MKRKVHLSIFAVVALILSVIVILYFFLYLTPTKQQMSLVQAETRLFKAQAQLIEPYLEDHSPLEQDIADIQANIDYLHANGYTNEATVNQVIAHAIQRYQVELTALTLEEVIDYDETHRALPIHMQINGTRQDVLAFVNYFETNQDGSFLVRTAEIQMANEEKCTMSMIMYLCAPSV